MANVTSPTAENKHTIYLKSSTANFLDRLATNYQIDKIKIIELSLELFEYFSLVKSKGWKFAVIAEDNSTIDVIEVAEIERNTNSLYPDEDPIDFKRRSQNSFLVDDRILRQVEGLAKTARSAQMAVIAMGIYLFYHYIKARREGGTMLIKEGDLTVKKISLDIDKESIIKEILVDRDTFDSLKSNDIDLVIKAAIEMLDRVLSVLQQCRIIKIINDRNEMLEPEKLGVSEIKLTDSPNIELDRLKSISCKFDLETYELIKSLADELKLPLDKAILQGLKILKTSLELKSQGFAFGIVNIDRVIGSIQPPGNLKIILQPNPQLEPSVISV
jgi:hypothetical protein